jgi:hypothetical protein
MCCLAIVVYIVHKMRTKNLGFNISFNPATKKIANDSEHYNIICEKSIFLRNCTYLCYYHRSTLVLTLQTLTRLKVGTNEKQGGSQRWQMVRIYLGQKDIDHHGPKYILII